MKIILTILCSILLTAKVFAGASITGTVKFDGQAPNFKEIKMDADPICVAQHKDPVFPQTLVLGDGNTMGSVFVYIKNAPASTTPAPTDPIVVDQKGCNYSPHVIGVRVGQPVKILIVDKLTRKKIGATENYSVLHTSPACLFPSRLNSIE